MNNGSPEVSIALPVYNGENYLREAIRSVLRQTFEDFELLLLDNASTDATSEICRETVEQDQRAHHLRSDVNRGLIWNHNRGVESARGQYFMWIEHDDLIAEDYLDRCVNALNDDPKIVLSFTNTLIIDENGKEIDQVSNHFDNSSPSSRVKSLARAHPGRRRVRPHEDRNSQENRAAPIHHPIRTCVAQRDGDSWPIRVDSRPSVPEAAPLR